MDEAHKKAQATRERNQESRAACIGNRPRLSERREPR